jgi:LacI family transcriptional regulator
MSTTRDDVAKLAGVSAATVSYVVNNGPRPVAEATRQRVLRAIEQLDYQPSAAARSLKTNKTSTIGIVIPDILNPILAFIAQSIEDELLPHGYNLILCNTKELAEREAGYLKMLVSKQADGLIIAPTAANRSLLFSMVESGKRIVLLDRSIEGLNTDCVLFDNDEGAYAAVQHLIALGHTRIGFINLPPKITPGAGRLRGYERALNAAGIAIDPELIKAGTFTAEDAQTLAEELLTLRARPTALFVSSNRLARGVLQLVKERGLALPDDLALCVYDDLNYYSHITPSITAVAHDYREFGRAAARLLVQRINLTEDDSFRVLTLPFELHVRESTVGAKAHFES